MADNLPADLVVLYQDAFAHFDTENTGIISTKTLGPLLRYCGENPSEAEVQVNFFHYQKYIYNYNAITPESLMFQHFLIFCSAKKFLWEIQTLEIGQKKYHFR